MEIELTGWSGAVVAVVAIAVISFFNAGVMRGGPTPEQILEKTGKKISNIIFAEAIFKQSAMFKEQAPDSLLADSYQLSELIGEFNRHS